MLVTLAGPDVLIQSFPVVINLILLFPACTCNLLHLGSFVLLFCVTHVYRGPDLASSANFIKGRLFTT